MSYWDKSKSPYSYSSTSYSSGSYSLGKHIYEIQLLKRIQEQTRLQEEQRRVLEEERRLLDRQRQMEQKQEYHRQEAQRQAQAQEEHIARINCMTEEEKDRLYKQMIKEREDDKRDYILKYGFEKWEKWQRYKLEHDL
jgi:hypothetical protein